MRYKIVFKQPECIGAFACMAMAPQLWREAEISSSTDRKVELIGGKKHPNGWQELEIESDDFQSALESAEVCPVNVIIIYDEKGKKIYP